MTQLSFWQRGRQRFNAAQHPQALPLNEADFRKALDSIDVSETDRVDLYEFALEHAEQRLKKRQ